MNPKYKNEEINIFEKVFRSRIIWTIIIPGICYLISGFWLGIYIVLIPLALGGMLIGMPSGFVYGAFNIELAHGPRQAILWVISAIIYYLIFGGLYIYFLINIKRLSRRKLYMIGVILMIILMITMKGCATMPSLKGF